MKKWTVEVSSNIIKMQIYSPMEKKTMGCIDALCLILDIGMEGGKNGLGIYI